MLALLCSFPSMDWKESSAVDDGDDNDENGKRWRASEADLLVREGSGDFLKMYTDSE